MVMVMQSKRDEQGMQSFSFGRRVSRLMNQAVDVILPARCVITGDFVEHQGMVSSRAWAELDFVSAPFCRCCGIPFEFEVDTESLCASCLDKRPMFKTARAALKYNDTSRKMILGFKHADKTYAVQAFAPWLKRAGENMLAEADFLAPVPLHRWRLVQRRYNQAALMAHTLAQDEDIDCLPDLLLRTRATPSQGFLSAKERIRNVRKAFALNHHYKDQIKGKKIVLVDDVYTTGATVNECTKVLVRAGAAEVNVLTLARVVRSGLGG